MDIENKLRGGQPTHTLRGMGFMPIGGPATGGQAGDFSLGGNNGFAFLTTGTPDTQSTTAERIISTLTNAALAGYAISQQPSQARYAAPTGGGFGQYAAGTPAIPSNSPNVALYVLGFGLLLGAVALGLAVEGRGR